MQQLPPQLELPEGDRFTLPTVSAVRELVPRGAQLPAHMVLMMICEKELWVPPQSGDSAADGKPSCALP